MRRNTAQTVFAEVKKYEYKHHRLDGPLLFKVKASKNSMVRTEISGYSVLGYDTRNEEVVVFLDYLAKNSEKTLVLIPKKGSIQLIRVLDQNRQVVFETIGHPNAKIIK